MNHLYQSLSAKGTRAAVIVIVAAMVLSGCSGGAAKPTEVKISAPAAGTVLNVGQGTVIQGEAVGDNVTRVEVLIDTQPYASLSTPDKNQGVPNFPVQVPWTPASAGSHAIQLRAYGLEDKLLAQSDPLVVEAKAAVAQATPVPPTQAPAPTLVPTRPPSGGGGGDNPPAATPAPAATQPPPTSDAPSLVVTNEFVNVRSGPNTAYSLLGRLEQNQTAPVRGKSADGQWWQITYSAGPNGVGWVFGEYVKANGAAASVPVASAPPLPTSPPAPPAPVAPTAVPPTAIPVQTLPTVGSRGQLRVSQNPVAQNGSVVASWSVSNIQGIWFDKGDGSGFQPAAGAQSVTVAGISAARTLQLKWKDNGGTEYIDQLTIGISGQAVPGPVVVPTTVSSTWAPKFKAGTNDPNANDTCNVASAGGSCTYYWMNMAGASGIWLRVTNFGAVGQCGGGNLGDLDPSGIRSGNEMAVTGPSGSLTIKFPTAGGYKISIRVAKDGNNNAYGDEKPMEVKGCSVSPTNTPEPTSSPAEPTPAPVP